VAVVAKLALGSRERATQILAEGTPYDLGETGFRRDSVFLGGATVVFVFEGSGIEWLVRDLVDDSARSAAFGCAPAASAERVRPPSLDRRIWRPAQLGAPAATPSLAEGRGFESHHPLCESPHACVFRRQVRKRLCVWQEVAKWSG
jgi:hypothetical protein